MAGNNLKVNGQVDLQVNLSAENAKQQLANLQKSLKQVSNLDLNVGVSQMTNEIQAASSAALELSSHLTAATNIKTGNLDFSKFAHSIQSSGKDLNYYATALGGIREQGQKSFMGLATAVAKSEIPLKRTNKILDTAWDNLKKTAGWQMSSSIIHGLIGTMQQAVGYAQDLNKSLTDIRIVTGASTEQMAQFAVQANKAAKQLNTTTTDYTKASLIYYQQGLSEAEVKARTETTVKMANVTGTTAQKVSDQMTAIWNNYDDGTKSLKYYADVMTSLGAKTASSTDEIAQGLQKFASISQTVGLSYEYAASALATITSVSRESADVVGNSLKTLFARVQGLQLGETLEDGTTLNKYSQALDKVGISIKDSNGEMKDMDNILNEMGAKWNTLSRDQQTALAQTVAGVRQYTQLMTLMNNWSFFKENVAAAGASSGTLDAQAAIFAESWEAASNRVRTSWEGLWDSLINSDSFISILDGFSSIITMAESLVDALGGAGGTLASLGGIMGRLFTPQIASSISNTVMGIRQLNPNARLNDAKTREAWLKGLVADDAKMDELGIGAEEKKVTRKQIEDYAKESLARDQRRRYMSQQELQQDMAIEAKLDDARTMERLGAQRRDKAVTRLTDLNDLKIKDSQGKLVKASDILNTSAESMLQKDLDVTGAIGTSLKNAYKITDKFDRQGALNHYNSHKSISEKMTEEDFLAQVQERSATYAQNKIKNDKAQWVRDEIAAARAIDPNTGKAKYSGSSYSDLMKYAGEERANFKEAAQKALWDNKYTDAHNKDKLDYAAMLDDIMTAGGKNSFIRTDEIQRIMKPMIEGHGTTDKNREQIREAIEIASNQGMLDIIDSMDADPKVKASILQSFMESTKSEIEGTRAQETAQKAIEKYKAQQKELDGQKKIQQTTEGVVQLAQGAASLVAASNAAQSLTTNLMGLSEGTSSLGDVLSSVTSVGLNAVYGMKGISDGLHNLGMSMKSASALGLGITAVTTALSAYLQYKEEQKQQIQELNEKTLESIDIEYEKSKKNKELINSVNDSIHAYKQMNKAYEKGEVTYEEVASAQANVVKATSSLSESYTIPGVTAAALAGNMLEVQRLQSEAREIEIARQRQELVEARTIAKDTAAANVSMEGLSGTRSESDIPLFGMKLGTTRRESDEQAGKLISNYINKSNSYIWDTASVGAYGFTLNDLATSNEDVVVDLHNFDDLFEVYTEFQNMLDVLEAQGYNATNSVQYKSMSAFVAANQENIQRYLDYQQAIIDLDVEKKAIDAEAYNVDNLYDYYQLRKKLIEQSTYNSMDPEKYQQAVNAVDAYLGTLSNLTNSEDGDLTTVAAGINDLYEKYRSNFNGPGEGIMDEDTFTKQMAALYEKYGNLIFSLNFNVKFNGETNLETVLASQLTALASKSNTLTINTALDTKSVMKSLGSGGSIEEWMAINQEIQRQKLIGKNGIQQTAWSKIMGGNNSPYSQYVGKNGGIDLFTLLTATPSTFNDILNYYTNGLKNEKFGPNGTINTTLKNNADELAILHGAGEGGLDALAADATSKSSIYKTDFNSPDSDLQVFDRLGSGAGVLGSSSTLMSQFTDALMYGDLQALPAIKQSLDEAGYNLDYLNAMEEGYLSNNEAWTQHVRGLNECTDAVNAYTDATIRAENLTNENTALQQEKNDYFDTQRLDEVRQDALDRGIDYSEVQELAAQYLAEGVQGVDLFNEDAYEYTKKTDDELADIATEQLGSNATAEEIQKRVDLLKAEGEAQKQNLVTAQERALAELETKQGIDELEKNYKSLSKTLDKCVEGSTEWDQAMIALKKSTAKVLNVKDWTKLSNAFIKAAKSAGLLAKAAKGDKAALVDLRKASVLASVAIKKFGKTQEDVDAAIAENGLEGLGDLLSSTSEEAAKFVSSWNTIMDGVKTLTPQQFMDNAGLQQEFANMLGLTNGAITSLGDIVSMAEEYGFDVITEPVPAGAHVEGPGLEGGQWKEGSADEFTYHDNISEKTNTADGTSQFYSLKFVPRTGGGGGSGGGGGGGGGGQPKEPKKVANKRKSQTVSRYKKNDFRRSSAEKAKKSEQQKTDYLYGEKRIEQLEKINNLTLKESRITADRIKESREYLVEDRKNLINYLDKYGFNAEFDTDGYLANYEEIWTKLHEEIAALYEDNELTEDEEKLEEEFNVKLEELEGALEDYENSLEELYKDIESYEESLYEIYDGKIDSLEHKVEFKIELEEDDLAYLDFWIESLGDSVYNAIEGIEAMGQKANMLFTGLDVYKQGIEDIYALSDDPFQIWATGGLEDILTQTQIDTLRDNRDGLADYMQQLIDLREEIKDKVINTFDLWQSRIEANISSIEHYSSVIEHFKNIIDTIGKDPFNLSNEFINTLEQSAINQSLDAISSQKDYYNSLTEQQLKAQEELDEARARGDESSAEHWEEVVKTTTESMEAAQDALLSSLNNTLSLIAEQFEKAMEHAIESFNDAMYQYGGLDGLSDDYNLIRENADLMAADYEKIYELSKLTRDINKVLDDTNIVAGKKKMNGLLKEINELQADGVELSKYDLEYLRAKYELRLAEIELENAQNSKDTVRLSKDSEGNWSYVYTQNADAVEEAEQKYEDALYEMQNLSQEYLEDMSGMMIETSQAMMEEISALRIQDFTSYEEYQTEIKRIQDKYAESLRHQENELNKAIQNSSDLYEQDWQAYNQTTGYKISLAEKWVDSFREATLGDILDINTFMSGFSETFLNLTDEMSAQLADAAIQYFENVDTAMKTYGTSINQFGVTTTTTIDNISQKSKTAKDDLKTMASEMSDAFEEIADYVSGWQEEFSGQIDSMLEEIKTLIQSINEAIRKSAELTNGQSGAEDLIGSAEAIELLNATGLFGTWAKDGSVGVKVDGKSTNFVDYNGALIEEIDDAVARYANAKTGTDERERLGEELKELFKRYWQFRDIVNRIYDPTNLTTNMDAPTFTSMDTGGYTGEWGDSGKLAMLHEKELVLNAQDTKNFLDALNISRDVINSMIEMNARASSLALGDLFPSLVQDFGQTLEQTVTITAEFPDATDHNEIEEAFNNLLNTASQYANRNRD